MDKDQTTDVDVDQEWLSNLLAAAENGVSYGPKKFISSKLLMDLVSNPSAEFNRVWTRFLTDAERQEILDYASETLILFDTLEGKKRRLFLDGNATSNSARIVLDGSFDAYLRLALLRYILFHEFSISITAR